MDTEMKWIFYIMEPRFSRANVCAVSIVELGRSLAEISDISGWHSSIEYNSHDCLVTITQDNCGRHDRDLHPASWLQYNTSHPSILSPVRNPDFSRSRGFLWKSRIFAAFSWFQWNWNMTQIQRMELKGNGKWR